MSRTTVQIDIVGPLARVTAPQPDLLTPLLEAPGYQCQDGGPRGFRLRKTPRRLSTALAPDPFVIPAGLVSRLQAELERRGLPVVVHDHRRPRARLTLDEVFLQTAPARDRPLLEALAREHRGQVRLATNAEEVATLQLCCHLFPEAWVLIVARNQKHVRALARRLQPELPHQVCTTRDLTRGGRRRALIAAMAALRDKPWHDFDLILLTSADRLLTARSLLEPLFSRGDARVYGLVHGDGPPTPYERLVLEAICGPVLNRSPAGPAEALRTVVLAEAPLSVPSRSSDALGRKRQAIWHNDDRNDVIAAVALALDRGDDDELARRLVAPTRALPLLRRERPPYQVIRVESPEHGRQLERRLPGWRLLTDRVTPSGWGPSSALLGRRLILTTVAAASAPRLDADVVLRADGGAGPLAWPALPPGPGPGGRPLLLIDLADDFDDQALANSQSRLSAYAADGWAFHTAPRWQARACESPRPGGHRGT